MASKQPNDGDATETKQMASMTPKCEWLDFLIISASTWKGLPFESPRNIEENHIVNGLNVFHEVANYLRWIHPQPSQLRTLNRTRHTLIWENQQWAQVALDHVVRVEPNDWPADQARHLSNGCRIWEISYWATALEKAMLLAIVNQITTCTLTQNFMELLIYG